MLDDLVSGLDALLNAPAAQGELSQ
jgi:hypothetical protein